MGNRVICAKCTHENEPQARFCWECGASLERQCPSCDAGQPAGAKFCNVCGTGLDAPKSQPVDTPAASTAQGPVRKLVTALFADLAGSTSFGEQLDPEAARAALAPYFDLLQATIVDHDGQVAKFTGDGVFAVFGVPEIAEDDAVRAVNAGLDLQRRFISLQDQIRERHGIELGLRVGVNTGELVIADDDADLVGDVLNTAARIEAACEPGRVLVGEDTWRLTRSALTYEVLGEIRAKGKAGPVATFQVVDGVEQTIDEVTPFVGRSAELDGLLDVFEKSIADTTAKLATIIGPPGVGKTRLAQELAGCIGARAFDLRFERRGSTTFSPIAELLREIANIESIEGIERLVEGQPDAGRLAPALGSFVGLSQGRSTEDSFWGVRRLLEVVAADEPALVVVDDIQWAEPLFWDLLDHLAEWTDAPVMVLALARPELRELRPELTQPGRRVAVSVALEGLDAAATRELAARLLDTNILPIELTDRLPLSTEGNPLFVRELVQMLVDDGALARTGDQWTLTVDVESIEVPPTVLSLLASRVERLPDDEREVVELASVIGTEFDRGTLDTIAPPDIAARMGAVIDRLRRKELVEPSGAWAGDHPVYRFHHVLIRDAAYRRLLKGRRADLHALVGHYVETVEPDGPDADVVVAHHYEQAVQYRAELGTVDDATADLARRAVERLRVTAEQALGREDLLAAGTYALRALDLAGEDDPSRNELLLLGCEALLSSGDVSKGAPLVDELAGGPGDARLSAWADCFKAQLWSLVDSERLTEAAEVADDAAARLNALGDDAGVAKARLVRASCLARLGRVGDCEQELDLALAAARSAGDRRRTVAVLGAAPLAALWGPSTMARAGGRCLDVLRLLRITTESPAVETVSIRCQGVLEALRGRFDSAREKLEMSRSIARELGLRHALFETELFAGFVELLADEATAAVPHLRLAQNGLGSLGIGSDAGQASALLARALLELGQVEEATEHAEAALDGAGQNLQTAMSSRSALAEIRAAQGRFPEASALIVEALDIAANTDVVLDHALALSAGARVAAAADDPSLADQRRSRAAELLGEKGVTPDFEPVPTRPTQVVLGGDLTNASVEVGKALNNAFNARDVAAIRALHSPDVAMTVDPSLLDVGQASAPDSVLAAMELPGDEEGTLDAMAVRGDDLSLLRQSVGQLDRFVVQQVEDGQITRVLHFGVDALGAARRALNELWVERGGPAWVTRFDDAADALGNPDLLRSFLTDDFKTYDHRTLGMSESDAHSFDDSLHRDGVPQSFSPTQVLAHTDSVGLVQFAVTHPDGSWDNLQVAVFVDNKAAARHLFDIDQLDEAMAKYEELTGGRPASNSPTNAAAELAIRSVERFRDRDFEALENLFSPDYQGITFVPFTDLDDVDGRDALMVQWRWWHEQGLDLSCEILAVRGADLVLVHNIYGIDGYDNYAVGLSEDGQFTVVVWFEGGQLEAATEELERRWAEQQGAGPVLALASTSPEFTNEALRLAEQFQQAHHSSDWESMTRLLAEDFQTESIGQLSVDVTQDRDGFIGSLRHLATLTDTPTESELIPIAIRSDNLVLTRSRVHIDDNLLDYFFLAEAAEGVIKRLTSYSPDQLDEALDELDRRWVTQDDTPEALTRLLGTMRRSMRGGDIEWGYGAFHPEFVDVDHRPFGMGTRSRDEFLQGRPGEGSAEQQSTLLLASQVAEWRSDRWLVRLQMSTDAAQWEFWAIDLLEGDQVIRQETFAIDDFAAAKTRYDELASAPTVLSGTGPEFTNDAVRVAEQFHRHLVDAKWEAMASLLGADFVTMPSGRRSTGASVGADGFIDGLRELAGAAERSKVHELTTLAIRAESLALVRYQITIDDNLLEYVVLFEVRDGLVRSSSIFYSDELDEALDELDRRWAAQGDDRPEGLIAALSVVRAAIRSGEPETAQVVFHSDFVHIDHRPLGLGTRSREELLRGLPGQNTTEQQSTLMWGSQIVEWQNDRSLTRFQMSTGAAQWEFWAIDLLEGDQIIHQETFAIDEFAAAKTRYDELAASTDTHAMGPEFSNDAWQLFQRMHAALKDKAWVELRRLLADEFTTVAVARHSTGKSIGPDEFVDVQREMFASDRISHDLELLAVRGDDLVLARSRLTEDSHLLESPIILETRDGLIQTYSRFSRDEFDEALNELDRRWLDMVGDPPDAAAGWSRARRAMREGDIDLIRSTIHRDFVDVDHRSLGKGTRSRDEFIQAMPGQGDSEQQSIWMWASQIVEYQSDRWLVRLRMSIADIASWEAWVVQVTDGGLALRHESFDVDDFAAAKARYEALATSGRPNSEFSNQAWIAAHGRSSPSQLIATRGETFCLVETTDALELIELGSDGALGTTSFELDELTAAQVELDHRWLTSIGIAADHFSRPMWSAAYEPQGGSVEQFLHPEFDFTDRRSLSFPSGKAPAFLGSLKSQVFDVRIVVRQVHVATEFGVVWERTTEFGDSEGQAVQLAVTIFQDELIRSLTNFETHQLDEALACYEELAGHNSR